MPYLTDKLTPEDRKLVEDWAKERLDSRYKRDIPPELYLMAQLGYYYGWQAVVDYRRNYHEGIDDEGKACRLGFSYEDAVALVKAAEKVHYRQMMDNGRIEAANNVSSQDKRFSKNNANYVNKLAKEIYKN